MVTIKDSKILVVEDEKDKREFLEKFLLLNGIEPSNLQAVCCSEKAIEEISTFYPDLILLDVKIPHTEEGVSDSKNSALVLTNIESFNQKFEKKIKTIIISATTEDKGLQAIVSSDPQKVFKMMDKSLLAQNPEQFKEILKDNIIKALNTVVTYLKPVVSIIDSYQNTLINLKNMDKVLHEYIKSEIFKPFEGIEDATENVISQAIIIRCGMVVEDLIEQFTINKSFQINRKLKSLQELEKLKATPYEEFNSIRDKLTILSGRKFNKQTKSLEIYGMNKISRQACEYAQIAYKNRNHASHTGKADIKNQNIFTDNNFTKEHASVSISLIIPLIQDYIKFKSK